MIPPSLRMGVHRICQVPPVGRSARWAYWRLAEAAARQLAVPGVEEVRLRGGMVRGCRPGLSDLDFSLRLSERSVEETAWVVERLGRRLQKLRRAFPLLGEVLIAPTPLWRAWDRYRHTPLPLWGKELVWASGDWCPAPARGSASEEAGFATAWEHFALGWRARHQNRGPYYRDVAAKEWGKGLLALGAQIPEGPELLRALSLWGALETRGRSLLSRTETQLPVEVPPRARPLTSVVAQTALQKLNRLWGTHYTLTPTAFVFEINDGRPQERMAALWNRVPGLQCPLVPASPTLTAALARGWGGWWAHEAFCWMDPGQGRLESVEALRARLFHAAVVVCGTAALGARTADAPYWWRRLTFESRALFPEQDLPSPPEGAPVQALDWCRLSTTLAQHLIPVRHHGTNATI